ncbi:MAG: hypothetical protein HOQ13_10210, partial [Dermatophilaceae bacterium]|nr:hypothetical protein [Dermatophilaceae bacterium]
MTVALVTAALVALSVLVILRPLALGRARPLTPAGPADEARDRLLRQLRDLDEDLASDKLDAADHARLRAPVERAAAEVLHELSVGAAAQARRAGRGPTSGPDGSPDRSPHRSADHIGSEPGGQRERPRGTRRRAWLVGLGAGAAVAVGVGALLVTSTAPRAPGETITGDAATGGPQ